MAKKKIIAWEHKHFPFERLDEDMNLVKNEFKIIPLENEDDEPDEDEEITVPMIMQTPFGMVAVDDTMNPYKNYEIRTGDTNFELTQQVCNDIEKTDGVEVFKKLSRYKFLIGIGKLFEFGEVRRDIEKRVCDVSDLEYKLSQIYDEDIKTNLQKVMNIVEDKKHFIYLFPNGNIEYVEESDTEFESKLEQLELCSHLSSGLVFTNI